MNNLELKYNELWFNALDSFNKSNVSLDPYIFSTSDNRKGISLIIKLEGKVAKEVESFLQVAKEKEPEQYYYSPGELHITALSLISCNENFLFEQVNVDKYVAVITEAIQGLGSFSININGITASPSCVMLQGFPLSEHLLNIRNQLRVEFSNSGLNNTIDQRYKIDTAHSTVIRFHEKLNNQNKFIQLLELFRKKDFGILHVKALHLVYNDWYHKEDKTIVLSTIKL